MKTTAGKSVFCICAMFGASSSLVEIMTLKMAVLARSRVYRKKGDEARARADQRKAAELDPSLEGPADPSL
jgi:hypothetical protein